MKTIKIDAISIDGGTQQRAIIHEDVVEDYAEAMRCGTKFPPMTVYHDGATYWLADGFHRYHASRLIEVNDVQVDVITGTLREAILYSASANATHGQRLTNADKRKAVMMLLQDKEWSQWSDRAIATHCNVTHPFVAKLREELKPKEKQEVKNEVVTVTTSNKPPKETPASAGKEKEYNPADDKQAELANAVQELAAENESLKDQIAAGMMPGSDEDRAAALETMQQLRDKIKKLEASLKQVTRARDDLMRENSEMKKQIKSLQKKAKA